MDFSERLPENILSEFIINVEKLPRDGSIDLGETAQYELTVSWDKSAVLKFVFNNGHDAFRAKAMMELVYELGKMNGSRLGKQAFIDFLKRKKV